MPYKYWFYKLFTKWLVFENIWNFDTSIVDQIKFLLFNAGPKESVGLIKPNNK